MQAVQQPQPKQPQPKQPQPKQSQPTQPQPKQPQPKQPQPLPPSKPTSLIESLAAPPEQRQPQSRPFRVLHLFSGPGHIGAYSDSNTTLKAVVEAFGRDERLWIEVMEIDWINCGCAEVAEAGEFCQRPQTCGNLLRGSKDGGFYEEMFEDCLKGKFACIVGARCVLPMHCGFQCSLAHHSAQNGCACAAGIPCSGYCIARFLSDGLALPLRDRSHAVGLNDLSAEGRRSLSVSNSLTVRGLSLCAAVWQSGGEVLIEVRTATCRWM